MSRSTAWSWMRRQWASNGGGTAAPAPVERGYLQANGINDYGIALNAALGATAAGTEGEICVVVKTASLTPLASLTPYVQIVGGGAGGIPASSVVTGYTATANNFTARGWSPDGTGDTITTATAAGSGGVVFAAARRNGDGREVRSMVVRRGSGTPVSQGAATPADRTDVVHVAFGCLVTLAGTLQEVSAITFVAGVLLNRYPTLDEVAAYSASDDARLIWPDAIHAYWAASDVVGTSIPARVGAVPMTLMGGWSASDLVTT